jgi:hypothetical protein
LDKKLLLYLLLELNKFLNMKRLNLLFLLGTFLFTPNLFAVNKGIEDTSIVRISTPEARAAFLDQIMKEKLSLEDEQYAAVQEINSRYEQQLQELTIANPASEFKSMKKKKEDDDFDKLSQARDKELKKALKGKQFKQYEKDRWGMRNSLSRQMKADWEEQQRLEQEKLARELEELAAKKRAEEEAAAKKVSAKKGGANKKESAVKGKTSAKKGAAGKKKPAQKKKK